MPASGRQRAEGFRCFPVVQPWRNVGDEVDSEFAVRIGCRTRIASKSLSYCRATVGTATSSRTLSTTADSSTFSTRASGVNTIRWAMTG